MRSTRRPVAIVALVVVALLGYAVAHALLSGGGSHPDRSSVATSAPTTGGAATTPDAEAPAGDSRLGAVQAAYAYLRALDQGSAAKVRALTLPPFTGQALEAAAATEALARRISAHGPAFVGGWRLGWRVDFYTRASARVAIWTVGTVESRGEVVAPYWSTTVCSLRRSGAAWRVLAARTTPGPTPPPDGTDPAVVAAFARAALSFRQSSDAP